jgi:hypothetical protein
MTRGWFLVIAMAGGLASTAAFALEPGTAVWVQPASAGGAALVRTTDRPAPRGAAESAHDEPAQTEAGDSLPELPPTETPIAPPSLKVVTSPEMEPPKPARSPEAAPPVTTPTSKETARPTEETARKQPSEIKPGMR